MCAGFLACREAFKAKVPEAFYQKHIDDITKTRLVRGVTPP